MVLDHLITHNIYKITNDILKSSDINHFQNISFIRICRFINNYRQ